MNTKTLSGLILVSNLMLVSLSAMSKECVILLHGLARTESSMSKLDSALTEAGYQTVNQAYPSRQDTIQNLADNAISDALKGCPEASKINFVTHSMGGILVRQFLSNHVIDNLNNVVMLGPPNQGSEVVDKLSGYPGFKFLNGPAGLQLGTGEMSVPSNLGAVDFNLGVIAGTKTINYILSTILPKPNDGKVSVVSTKVDGMKDHISLPVTHTFMMRDRQVIKQVLRFLADGHFDTQKE